MVCAMWLASKCEPTAYTQTPPKLSEILTEFLAVCFFFKHLLAGISSFKEGIDRLCESSGYRQRVLSPHGERTGSSGAACQ